MLEKLFYTGEKCNFFCIKFTSIMNFNYIYDQKVSVVIFIDFYNVERILLNSIML